MAVGTRSTVTQRRSSSGSGGSSNSGNTDSKAAHTAQQYTRRAERGEVDLGRAGSTRHSTDTRRALRRVKQSIGSRS